MKISSGERLIGRQRNFMARPGFLRVVTGLKWPSIGHIISEGLLKAFLSKRLHGVPLLTLAESHWAELRMAILRTQVQSMWKGQYDPIQQIEFNPPPKITTKNSRMIFFKTRIGVVTERLDTNKMDKSQSYQSNIKDSLLGTPQLIRLFQA